MEPKIELMPFSVRASKKEEGNPDAKEFEISNENRDRHRTRLMIDRWELENYNKNGQVSYQHNIYGDDFCEAPNPDFSLGIGSAFVEDKKLIGGIIFEPENINPLAHKIKLKVEFGTLKMSSVGFFETSAGAYGEGEEAEGEANETYIYGGQELLEWSIVNIPSNPSTGKRDLGSLREQNIKILKYIKNFTGKSYTEIESLTVKEILDSLQNRSSEDFQKMAKSSLEVYQRDFLIRQSQILDLSIY